MQENTTSNEDFENKSNSYFITSDHDNQSICWMPQLVGSMRMESKWHMKFLVPKQYMMIASGK